MLAFAVNSTIELAHQLEHHVTMTVKFGTNNRDTCSSKVPYLLGRVDSPF